MTFIYISIGSLSLLTIHINSKITDNSPSTMTSNRDYSSSQHETSDANRDAIRVNRVNEYHDSSFRSGHQTLTSSATKESSSTFTGTFQDEAEQRESISPNSSSNFDPRLGALENNAVYLAVHARSLPGSYHCGLFIPRCKEIHQGLGWTANNDQGGWNEEILSFDAVFNNSHLLFLHRVGQIHEGRETICEQKLRNLRADGTSSENRVAIIPESSRLVSGKVKTHEHGPAQNDLNSMARVKQAIGTLLDSNLITVSADRSATLEDDVSRLAGQIWHQVVRNKMQALVT